MRSGYDPQLISAYLKFADLIEVDLEDGEKEFLL